MKVAVCWKYVTVGGPFDGGDAADDTRWSGVSPADEAALEIALSLRDATAATVTVAALGPPAADDVLRAAAAVGADRVVRIDAPTTLDSSAVAEALAGALRESDLVWCGDYSLDRGTASVPAFLAAHLGAAQALGLVGVDLTGFEPGAPLRVVRRLDGGRRELLDVATPAVLSVEGAVATLRRAGLTSALAARETAIEVIPGPRPDPDAPAGVVKPYRPRARALAAPAGGTLARVRDILDVGHDTGHAETVTLDPPEAAARILAQLREWGYLDPDA